MVSAKQKVLVVDDEPHIVEMLKDWLSEEGYDVYAATTAPEALKLFYDVRPALSVVDLRLPGMSGFQLIGRIRELSKAPVLILSAMGGDSEQVQGLDTGADEYVVKPVSRDPFLARIRSLLRRAVPPEEAATGRYADSVINLDAATYTTTVKGQALKLSPLEFKLLAYLVEQRNRVVSHEELLSKVWEADQGSMDSLKWYVSSLRRKLEVASGLPQLITNVRGQGYRYVSPDTP